jgi:hypothetical protein
MAGERVSTKPMGRSTRQSVSARDTSDLFDAGAIVSGTTERREAVLVWAPERE